MTVSKGTSGACALALVMALGSVGTARATAVAAASGPGGLSAQAVNLSAHDAPAGFAAAGGEPMNLYRLFGLYSPLSGNTQMYRSNGYQMEFRYDPQPERSCTGPAPRGCAMVEAVTLVFGSTAAAHAVYRHAALATLAPAALWTRAPIGDEGAVMRGPLTQGGSFGAGGLTGGCFTYNGAANTCLLFRRGPVIGLVMVGRWPGAGARPLLDARSVARLIDGRIQRALGAPGQ